MLKDGTNFSLVNTIKTEIPTPDETVVIKSYDFKINGEKVQYLKVVAKNLGKFPTWHLGYPHNGRSWIFVDEITIN